MAYPNYNKNNKDKYPWMGQVILNGKRKRRLFKTKKAALQWEVSVKEQKSELTQQEIPLTSLLEWGTAYLEYASGAGGFAKKTVEEKQLAFRLLFKEVNPYDPVEKLSSLVVLRHLQKQAKIRSGNAANKQRKNLRVAWQWGVKYLNLPESNPFSVIEKFAESRSERRVPTLEEFWKVYDICDTEQDKLMLRMYLETGARRDELFRLQWRDVDFKKKQVRLRWKKNQKGQWEEAWLPVRETFLRLLKGYQKVTGLQKYVFLNMNGDPDPANWVPYLYRQHWLKRLCRRAGVEVFGFHGIRHLFASLLAADNKPLVEIQYMLRHKSLTTTQRYIHRLKKENREVLSALPDFDTRTEKSTKSPPEKQKAVS
ncbi:tyrosine-type recombinase/integrase [Desulfogranum japonicum]|uniref:tyrosine-type recombinase/integrase n=1 Tax=Desulfogranum japonicum TaxID=231447 RepID=UPI0004009222|nr:site-specific integrase [Desulfogranum japonicum]